MMEEIQFCIHKDPKIFSDTKHKAESWVTAVTDSPSYVPYFFVILLL